MRFLLFSILLLLTIRTSAQSWSAVGLGLDNRVRCFYSDSSSGNLYVGGHFFSSGFNPVVNSIASWNGFQWDSLSEGTELCSPSGCYPVMSIEKFNSEIYAGGLFYGMQNASNTRGIAKWNGTSWLSVGDVDGYIYDMAVYNNLLFVIGRFDSISGIGAENIAAYDGVSWQSVADTLFANSFLYVLDVYQGQLCVGGARWNASASTACVYNYDGLTWTDIGSGSFTDTASAIMTMKVYQNELYVGGTFRSASGAPGENIAKWNGISWSGAGGGITDTLNISASVLSMCVHDNKLVVGGYFKKAGGIYAHNIALWDGSLWCGIGNPFNVYVEALISHDDTLYAGGGFTNVEGNNTIRYIAKWIAPNAIDTCGVTGIEDYPSVEQVIVYPNPASEIITFQFSGSQQSRSIIICDALGREIWRKETNENTVEYFIDGTAPGLYYYRIEDQGAVKFTGKLIIE